MAKRKTDETESREHDFVSEPLLLQTFKASAIFTDPAFNSRKTKNEPSDEERENGALTDQELIDSIRARGLDTPVRVNLLQDSATGELLPHLVFGFRRHWACSQIDPDYPITCTIQPSSQTTPTALVITNLVENVQRSNLKWYEKADSFYSLTLAPHKMKPGDIAKELHISDRYVANLVRMRRQLVPELWAKAVQLGKDAPMHLLREVASLPAKEQLEAYSTRLRAERGAGKGGRPPGAKNKEKPGDETETDTRCTSHDLGVYVSEIPALTLSPEFKAGALYALRAANGDIEWDPGSVLESNWVALANPESKTAKKRGKK